MRLIPKQIGASGSTIMTGFVSVVINLFVNLNDWMTRSNFDIKATRLHFDNVVDNFAFTSCC